jgi:hypothetical protein
MVEEVLMPTYSPAEQARQRAAISPATQWRRESENWFDGSVESVDSRLAACDRLLAGAREQIANDGFGAGTRKHIGAIEDLEQQRHVLAGLRHDLLTAASDRGEFGAPQQRQASNLSSDDRRYVELESAKFVRANSDCPADELAIRARHHAEVKTSTFTQQRSRAVTAEFVERVAQLRRATPRPRVAMAPLRSPDFPPELMFL